MVYTDGKFCCGLLSTFIIEANANFQLETGEGKDVIMFPPNSQL